MLSLLMRPSMIAMTILVLVGGSVTAAPLARGPVKPSIDAPTRWGYVVSRRINAPTYAPRPMDQGNSSGHPNTVTWTETGHYEVTMPGLADAGGAVVVSPLGVKPRRCVVEIWFIDGSDELIDLACFTRSGSPVDSAFVLTYLVGGAPNTSSPPGFGYLWADQPNAVSDYLPARKYNSVTGSSNPVRPLAQGSYRAGLNALGSLRGNVQLTAVAHSAATCQTSWGPVNLQMQVLVQCRETGSALANMQFELVLTDKAGLKGIGATGVAYLTADRPTDPSYTATKARRYSSAGKAPTIARTARGTYVVTLKGMPLGGAAVVTPLIGRPAICTIAAIRKQGLPQRIGVRCFGADGQPKDTPFSLSFLR